jgi:hypothetical protein
MNIFQPTLLLMLLLLLGGCAKPLQPDNYAERISSTWLDANRFIVAYPRQSTEQQVIDLALLHSAEIALQNGFNYFIVVNSDDSVDSSAEAVPAAAAEFILYDGIRYQHASPASSNTIICFQRKPPGFSYVALFVKASLRAKYGLDQQAAPI